MPSGPTTPVSKGIFGRLNLRRTTESVQPRVANPPAPTDASVTPEEQQGGRSQEQPNKRDARTQFMEGESASRLLHGTYPGDLASAFAARLTGMQGRKDWAARAIWAYTNAISLDASMAEALLGRARVYRFLRRYSDAKSDLRRVQGPGSAAAIREVKKLERRSWATRLAVFAVLAGACALWRVESSHVAPAPNDGESTQRVAGPAAVTTPPAQVPRRALSSDPSPAAAAPASPRGFMKAPGSLPQHKEIHPGERRVATGPSQPQRSGDAGDATPVPTQTSDRTGDDGPTADSNCVPPRPGPFALAPPTPEQPAVTATGPQLPEAAYQDCASSRHSQVEANVSLPALSASSPSALAALGKDEVEMMKLACRSSEQGDPEAYRACIASQIASLEEAMPMPQLSVIPALDRQLIQRACASATPAGPASYRRCIGRQLIGLAGAPEIPDLSGFNADRKRSIELACGNSATSGPAAYHTCLDRQAKQWRRGLPSASRAPADPKQLDR